MESDLVYRLKKMQSQFKRSSRVVKILLVLYCLDFFSFFIVCLVLGGDAQHGFEQSGRYFLSNHGRLTETTEAIFRFNKSQGVSLFILFPILAITNWFDVPAD